MNIKESISQKLKEIGLDTFGFLKCEVFHDLKEFLKVKEELSLINEFEESEIEKRINPLLLMPEGKTIISIAFPYYVENHKEKGEIYFSRYTRTSDYHRVVHKYLDEVIRHIESLGGKALGFVDSNPLPERYIAMKSGVGFIGKNNMIITEKYGSYVFLGEIITDLEIEEDIPKENLCGECRECIKACPTKSIKNINEKNLKGILNNSKICLSYITQKKDIDFPFIKLMDGRLFGCDSCQESCPYNKDINNKIIKEFESIDYMDKVNLEELLNLDNAKFKEFYKCTSCGWRGKNILIRNSMIAAYNKGKLNFEYINNIKSPYIKEYFEKILSLKHKL